MPDCIAWATKDDLCAAHASVLNRLPPEDDPASSEGAVALVRAVEEWRAREPRLSPYLLEARVAPLPVPRLLDFQFYSPFATALVALALPARDVTEHFRELALRLGPVAEVYQRKVRVGVFGALTSDPQAPYADWDVVSHCLARGDLTLPVGERRELEAQAGRCQTCGKLPHHLTWTYYMSELVSWWSGAGVAGWLAVCPPCRQQVALFVDRLS